MSPEEKKEKARESARASYNANKERYLERGRAWRAANKEKVKANNAAYHAANRERENARSRAWKEENRDAMNARRRADYAANIKRERASMRERKKWRYWRNPQKYRALARLELAMPGAKPSDSISVFRSSNNPIHLLLRSSPSNSTTSSCASSGLHISPRRW